MPVNAIIQAIAGTLYLATISTVGIRVLILARRNRGMPELLLGISLVVGGTFGASLEAGGMSGTEAELEPALAGALYGTGKAFSIVGFVCQALFIRNVFRPTEAWAAGLVAMVVFAQLGLYTAYAAAGTFSTGVIPKELFLVEFVARAFGSVWFIAEALRYYGMMRKRLSLGLADPMVTDRFRVWAVAGILGLVMLGTSLPPVIVGDPNWWAMDLIIPVFAATGIASSAFYLLAFFPPAWYRARVMRRLGGANT